MKQLFKNHKATTLFFSGDATIYEIMNWLQEQVIFGDNLLNLNEPHSCGVTISDDEIHISGDEDFVVITLDVITPIL